MSRLTDTLASLGQSPQARLGFGPAEPAHRTPVMLLIGAASTGLEPDCLKAAAPYLDAAIFSGGDNGSLPPKTLLGPAGDRIWGVSLAGATAKALDRLEDSGCDFLLIESEDAPGILIRDDGMAKGFPTAPGMPDERARALEDLPFDFLALNPGPELWPLTVASLLKIQGAISVTTKHIFLRLPEIPSPDELRLLRDLPVSALIVDLPAIDQEALKSLRHELDALEPRKPSHDHGHSPPIHALHALAAHGGLDHGGEEDWDDDYDHEHGLGSDR